MPEFDVPRVEAGLVGTQFAGLVHYYKCTNSTNTLALQAAQAGSACGVWVADEQTLGRGRGEHGWHSAAGDGLYCSALVMTRISILDTLKIPLAAGLAARKTLAEEADVEVDLRWPNDLMVHGKKCGGILVETASEGLTLQYAVIGIGINLNQTKFPSELITTATSLQLATGRTFSRENVLAALLRNLEQELTRLPTVLERFTEASSWVRGKRVIVCESGGYTGVTSGLDPHGFLRVLATDGTMRTVISGGVRVE